MKPLIPMFYYPLKLMFVDDDFNYLMAFNHIQLPNSITLETQPETAITTLQIAETKNPISYLINNGDVDLTFPNNILIHFNIDNIRHLINDTGKYEQYYIVVCDYQMPTMNGVTFFNQISKLPVKKFC